VQFFIIFYASWALEGVVLGLRRLKAPQDPGARLASCWKTTKNPA